jgi:hypothetical protein
MTAQNITSMAFTTPEDFAGWGLGEAAYVRQSTDTEGNAVWGIFRADGQPLGAAPTRDVALAAILQYELQPLSTH